MEKPQSWKLGRGRREQEERYLPLSSIPQITGDATD